jgi:DNA-directed RNA polymerase subunit M/transcription elongation factor TFIIS
MPLPKLDTPKYTAVIPSSKKQIQYRPFLVKEEKILMMAQESEDANIILNSIKDIISACVYGDIKVNDLTMYDIEYLFLQLRAKSVGETAEIRLKCEDCGEYNTHTINLNDIQVVFPEGEVSNKIQLTDDVGIELKRIGIEEATKISKLKEDKAFVHGIAASIDSVYDKDSVYTLADFSEKEIVEFIESFNRAQLEQIQKFIDNQPVLSHTIKFKCSKCGHENEITLKGLQSFFT